MIAIQLRGVGKTYPPPTQVHALVDVDVAVRTGESVAIVGPSGSGKSTMLSIMGTLERPTAGSVWVNGIDTSTLPDSRICAIRAWHIGFVFQQFFLIEHLSVLDNVADGLLYRGIARRQRRAQATVALERVGLTSRMQHRPTELSGGERQRVAIARAVIGRPELVLADEPTGNLDTETGAEIVDLLAELTDEHTTVVVITHAPDVASAMSRHVGLRDGRVVSDSDPA